MVIYHDDPNTGKKKFKGNSKTDTQIVCTIAKIVCKNLYNAIQDPFIKSTLSKHKVKT